MSKSRFFSLALFALVSNAGGQVLPGILRALAAEETVTFKRPATPTPALFSKPIKFDHDRLYKEIEAIIMSDSRYFDDMESSDENGVCTGVTELFALLHPSEIRNFIKNRDLDAIETEVLLAFITAIQFPEYSYHPFENTPGEYYLELRDGSVLEADSSTELFTQLWSKHSEQCALKLVGGMDDFLRQLPDVMQEGIIYRFDSPKHAMLLQKHEGKYKFFDPNGGIHFFDTLQQLKAKLVYLVEKPASFYLALWEDNQHSTAEEARKLVAGLNLEAANHLILGAIDHGDLVTARVILETYPEIKHFKYEGNPFLTEIAVSRLDPEFLQSILSDPTVEVNAQDGEKKSALYLAAKKNHPDTVCALLAHPDIDVNLKAGRAAAIHIAAVLGHTEVMELLLAHPDTEVDLPGPQGQTALYFATEKGHSDVVEQLLHAGASPSPSMPFFKNVPANSTTENVPVNVR